MTIQEAFECMVNKEEVKLFEETIKIKYISEDGSVWFIRDECISFTAVKVENLSKIKPTKRYWIWDIKSLEGPIYKSHYYSDDEGMQTSGKKWFSKSQLIKKHENEFIDVDVEQ